MVKKSKVKKDKKDKKDKTRLKNKNKNKNIVVVNVNSHNKNKEEKHVPQAPVMPYVISTPQSQPIQSQPIIIQQPAQPNYLHYQPPNAVHLGSQNAVPINNNFQSPRRVPSAVRIPSANVIETQTELTGTELNETLQEYQNRISVLNNRLNAEQNIARRSEEDNQNQINALRERLQQDRDTIDDMNEFIANLRRERDETTSNAESLFNQLNRERMENQLLDNVYQEKLRLEEKSKHLLKEELFATQVEKNKLRFFIEDQERSRGKLIEGKPRQQSPIQDIRHSAEKNSIKNYVAPDAPVQPSLASAFRDTSPKQKTMDKYITPIQNTPSNYLDPNASNMQGPTPSSEPHQPQVELHRETPLNDPNQPQVELHNMKAQTTESTSNMKAQTTENADERTIQSAKSAKLDPEDRRELVSSLLQNHDFMAFMKTIRGFHPVPVKGGVELVVNKKKLPDKKVIELSERFL